MFVDQISLYLNIKLCVMQLRNWEFRIWVHIWMPLNPILSTVLILLRGGQPLGNKTRGGSKIMSVPSLLIFNSPSLMSSKHKQPISIIKVSFITLIISFFYQSFLVPWNGWCRCHILVCSAFKFAAKDQTGRDGLPRPEDFTKALYMFDIGQNDLDAGFRKMSNRQILVDIPNIITLFANAVQVCSSR